ncbi:phosphoribosylanthranilate isomerase [Altererythrobacter xixiisoli]|uniref:N-(5'-phosphoribosyl)anthranilate isomerase n=1 Tax=Croceibacterium xixiisoli TaxID=1476466 RepID=A0A6I4TSA8_9SPHN|nr:phosphoribosylanthranilate isomerase [Croceibacterium xixiisoli]MXO99015.1 phosphoribosylanthranilate isomerase [Croceibacterium xixiisoli]
MQKTETKICGIKTEAALTACIEARADYCGFNFYPPSPRFLPLADAARLSAQAAGRIQRVALFVDASDAVIAETLAAAAIDAIQLHGHETPARLAEVKARFGLPVWKALPIATAADVEQAADYRGLADLLLFDAKTPKGALPGGMGLSFDWSLLSAQRVAGPWGLAGGLSADNVADAIRQTGTRLVDTSSGVESAPGEKDPDKIRAFCRAVHAA